MPKRTRKVIPQEEVYSDSQDSKQEEISEKKQYRITGISKESLWLVDDKGNGYKVPIAEEYKKLHIGDFIYL